MEEAAEVVAPVRDDVVVFGAVALVVALNATPARITPTRDVDLIVRADRAQDVIRHLERSGLERSSVPHERSFTWVRDDPKVQLVRPFAPFAKGAARELPSQPPLSAMGDPRHRDEISFEEAPSVPRCWSVSTAYLPALKGNAFGRARVGEDAIVERDYHDAHC
jgi:hypothetical protein